MIKKFNDPAFMYMFEDKATFAEHFSKYFKRDWISSESLSYEQFLNFINNKSRFIMKPVGSSQGQGIAVFDDLTDSKEIYDFVTKEPCILEEWIDQHPVLSAVYADAINCLRIITVFHNGETAFLTGGVTWGNGKKIANASASGIVSPVDFETGKLLLPAADFDGHSYEKHPITGANLVGLQLPFWKETLEMLKSACSVVPQEGYIGWDIAITPDGPVLIEGNTSPGYRYYQIPVHMINKTGKKPFYDPYLKK